MSETHAEWRRQYDDLGYARIEQFLPRADVDALLSELQRVIDHVVPRIPSDRVSNSCVLQN